MFECPRCHHERMLYVHEPQELRLSVPWVLREAAGFSLVCDHCKTSEQSVVPLGEWDEVHCGFR
jgi:hypothetical protein